MTDPSLAAVYRRYIACLNRQDWANLGEFVHDDATHNGRPFGLSGYRQMLENDFEEIPDLVFTIQSLICDPPQIAARLWFDCSPKAQFLGLPINGRKIAFAEHAFYRFEADKIKTVWSILDKASIEAQLG